MKRNLCLKTEKENEILSEGEEECVVFTLT